ncbi:MAG: DUF1015 domain-containing protein [Gemmatimonadota bacterium]|nr:DUF1015 domain-containing protein [Gemmatimonadota bacterium]
MPHLEPFRALRYGSSAGPLDGLLAPPYDVIDEQEAARLRARSPWNAVRLVLPEGEAPARYETAARRLEEWESDGILVRDQVPSVTLVRQRFTAPEGPSQRLALFAALRLESYGSGGVVPHERTHSGPRRDRLALTLATRAQLSPVFFAAHDLDGALLEGLQDALDDAAGGSAAQVVRAEAPDGTVHEVRTLSGDAARAVCDAAGAGPLLIADGHHRYETALEVARSHAAGLPGADRVLACVVSGGDPGLRIRATHRCIPAPPPGGGSWTERLAARFALRFLPDGDGDAGRAGMSAGVAAAVAAAAADRAARTGSLVVLTGGRAAVLSPSQEAKKGGAGAAASWDGLDDVDAAVPGIVFDRLVVEGILGRDADEAARDGLLSYHRVPEEGARAAGDEGALFLLPPAGLEAIRAVTALGRRLPPKSTYFEPKVPSGLLFRPLAED